MTSARCEDLNSKLKVRIKFGCHGGEVAFLAGCTSKCHSQTEFSKVVLNTEQAADDKLMLLQGSWAPATQIPEITDFLNQQEAYFEIADPTPEGQCTYSVE